MLLLLLLLLLIRVAVACVANRRCSQGPTTHLRCAGSGCHGAAHTICSWLMQAVVCMPSWLRPLRLQVFLHRHLASLGITPKAASKAKKAS